LFLSTARPTATDVAQFGVEAHRIKQPDSPVITGRLASFNDFHLKSVANLRRLAWEDLVAALGPGTFSAPVYLDTLRRAGVPADATEAIQRRFGFAGIHC
jgi:hypothetical protein